MQKAEETRRDIDYMLDRMTAEELREARKYVAWIFCQKAENPLANAGGA